MTYTAPRPANTDPTPQAEPRGAAVSRRRFGRGVLLGVSGSAAAAVFGADPAGASTSAAAPATDKWLLGGNGHVRPDGTNFIGPNNRAPMIFKTAATDGNPAERARITPTGDVGIATTSPDARLHVVSTNARAAVRGDTLSTEQGAHGVTGRITSRTGGAGSAGVYGVNNSDNPGYTNGYGVHGTHDGAGYGVFGSADAGTGVGGTGADYGVYGVSPLTGVAGYGTGTDAYGVQGSVASTSAGIGVLGQSSTGYGVVGDTDAGLAVHGRSYGDGFETAGVVGESFGDDANGVIGRADSGSDACGIWGVSADGYAGLFSGDVTVIGTLAKGAGSFQIDHPLDPANRYLYHSFVESPDMMNIYNGNAITDDTGHATVELPEYFEALNRDFRYQLTVIGQLAQAAVATTIAGNRFTIMTDKPDVEVSWQVTGIRQDAFANQHRIPTEVDKPAERKGTYLYPGAHGQPLTAGAHYDRLASVAARRSVRPAMPNIAAP